MTSRPLLAEAYAALATRILDRVDAPGLLADMYDTWNAVDIDYGREALSQLAALLVAIVHTHRSDDEAHCSSCGVDWPCPTVCVIHERITATESRLGHLVEYLEDR